MAGSIATNASIYNNNHRNTFHLHHLLYSWTEAVTYSTSPTASFYKFILYIIYYIYCIIYIILYKFMESSPSLCHCYSKKINVVHYLVLNQALKAELKLEKVCILTRFYYIYIYHSLCDLRYT